MSIHLASKELIRIFWENEDYRDFLRAFLEQKLSLRVATKSQLATLLDVSSSYVTKILKKEAHITSEHAEALAKALGFNEHLTLAFLDRLILARSSSQALKDIVSKRLRSSFDISFRPIEVSDSAKKRSSASLLFYKIAKLLSGDGATVQELSASLKMQEKRVVFLLEKMSDEFTLDQIQEGETVRFKLGKGMKFGSREPGSHSLRELAFSLRRLATYSLESRYPIHLVDDGEHYVSGSYILPLNKEQIRTMSVLFSQLTQTISQHATHAKVADGVKYVGVCFDMFDTDI